MTPSHGRSFVSSNHGTQPIQMEELAALAASVAQMVVAAALHMLRRRRGSRIKELMDLHGTFVRECSNICASPR